MLNELVIEEGFTVIKLENESSELVQYKREVDNSFIQIHFSLNKEAQLHYGPHYSLDIEAQKSVLLYNPNQDLPIDLSLNKKGKYLIFIVTIKLFHSFFSQVAEIIPFLNTENRDKKYYLDKDLAPSEILVLNQIFDNQKYNGMQKLYIKAKAYETLSLYFDRSQEDQQPCPFLKNEANVEKNKESKENGHKQYGGATVTSRDIRRYRTVCFKTKGGLQAYLWRICF